MSNMNQSELDEILKQHKLWVDSLGKEGKQADLERANLERANLERANLREANLEGASLLGANLRDAFLEGANLIRANLKGANLKGAILEGADLEGANLEGANLEGANLEGADLERAKLPEKLLQAGKLYEISSFKYGWFSSEKRKQINFDKTLVCLISINRDNSLDFIEGLTGEIYRNADFWLKYSFKEIEK